MKSSNGALKDFMENLIAVDESKVIFSEQDKKSIKVIPPEKSNKIIISHLEEPQETKKSTKIKLNIKSIQKEETKQENSQLNLPREPLVSSNHIVQEEVQKQEVIKEPTKKETKKEQIISNVEIVESLFLESGTEESKRSQWFEIYGKAQDSRKKTTTAELLRRGRFLVTINNEILFLPENYSIKGKNSTQMLKEKWI